MVIRNTIKKIIIFSISFSVSILNGIFLTIVNAENENSEATDVEFGVYAASGVFTVDELLNQSRFLWANGGKGFAAEEANNLIDNIKPGQQSQVVGYNNASNGADRIVIGRDGSQILVQDKYYATARQTVDACFGDDGIFRYLDGNGNPMQIEVPSDQYELAVTRMRQKIIDSKVPGVTDPDEAQNIIRKGNITFQQAVNLTKAGTIESLTYDAAKGCVSAATAFGIGTTLDFAIRVHNGEEWKEALKESSMIGLKTGARAFAITVISSQLAKTNVTSVFRPGAEALVNSFGDDFAAAILKAYGTNVAGLSVNNAAITLLQSQALVQTVTVIVLSVPDVIDLIRGRISPQQLLMNLAVATAGVVGSTVGGIAGSAAGSAVAPGAGSYVGGLAGGIAGGVIASYGTNAVLHVFYEDDAEKMLSIIQDEFYQLSSEYLVTEDEANAIADQLTESLQGDTLKDMFASEDPETFARDLMEPLFEQKIKERESIIMPTNEEMRYQLKQELQGVVFIH